jgi:S-adenosylmethionine:tRNA-ribosyltransferase-isomerase (queuine synthetase)
MALYPFRSENQIFTYEENLSSSISGFHFPSSSLFFLPYTLISAFVNASAFFTNYNSRQIESKSISISFTEL